ncbi:MAG: hypothetical protein WCY68_04075 [Desulfuromonadales bacterium]
MLLEMTPEEGRLLQEVMESYLSDLRMEISDTDSLDYRMMLKERKERLAQILKKLKNTSDTSRRGTALA